MKARKRKLLGFVHIEKTAGTSMIHILRHNFAGRYMDVRPMTGRKDRTFRADDLRLTLRVNPFVAAIGGHSVMPGSGSGLEDIADMAYITLFRDPIRRYISQYRYWRSALGMQLSPEAFFELDHAKNKQIRKIAGEENLQKAIDLLESQFLAYGLVEQFEEFIAVMCDRLGNSEFEAIGVTVNQTGRAPFSVEELLERHHDVIVENNEKDAELYRYVQRAVAERSDGNAVTAIRKLSRPSVQLYADYVLRKAYYQPVTGLIRRFHGMEATGSY